MAHHVEPMDIDSDFDNKENSLRHNNVLPFTEKGYEELDVSELNMKLRYSDTPVSSPMSKSFTAYCTDNRNLESGDDSLNVTVNENFNLSHSLNSTMTKNCNLNKPFKALPLQTISTEQFVDSNRNTSVLRPVESAVPQDNGNITVTVSAASDIDESLSLPSSSSSALHTPEATTPTNIPIKDGGSPIMRGLKSVLNMFRSSQSPIPSADNENIKPDILSPAEDQKNKSEAVLASTPIASHRKKEMSPTKRSSPQKDNTIVFNDDLEKELQWKDETTIIFSQERIPIHKLMLQQPQDSKDVHQDATGSATQDLNSTVEYMDISYNDSFRDRTITEIQVDNLKVDATLGGESDSEFVDCETTFTKNKSPTIDDMNKTNVLDLTQGLDVTKDIQTTNDSGSRLKQIILDTTQDILDATLSVRPEDLLPEINYQTKNLSELVMNKTDVTETSKDATICKDTNKVSSSSQVTQAIFNQTVDISPVEVAVKDNEPSDHNETFELSSTTQPINQTFDAASFTINNENHKHEINDTIVLERKDITPDLNSTKTIDVISSSEAIHETYDASNSTITYSTLKDNLNVTNTIENILGMTQILDQNASADYSNDKTNNVTTINQPINQTFDASSLINEEHKKEELNVTKTFENVLDVTQVPECNELADPICTRTVEVTLTHNFDQALNSTHSIENDENQRTNLDVTKTLVENNLNVTEILANKSENLNSQLSTTIVLDDNKNFDTEVASLISNVQSKTNELSSELEQKGIMATAEIPFSAPVATEGTIVEPLPISDVYNPSDVQDVTMTELPADIPLPDEDDLEKELLLPTDTSPEDTPPASLPLDLVDDIKITSKINEINNTETEGSELKLSQNSNKDVILPEVCPSNTSKLEICDITHEAIQNSFTETATKSEDNTKQINIETEMSNLCQEVKDTTLIDEIISTSNIIINDERLVDKEIEECKKEETNFEINMIETGSIEKAVEEISQDIIQNQDVVSINNDNVSELKPLPDIINQTIAVSNTENFGGDTNVPETVSLDNIESLSNNTGNLSAGTVISELDVNEIKEQKESIDIECINSVIKDGKIIEDNSLLPTSGDMTITQELSDVVVTSSAGDTAMSENVTGAIDLEISDAIPTESIPTAVENISSDIEVGLASHQPSPKNTEEIVLSENNSPFVSVIADNIPETDNTEDSFATKNKVVLTPPASPPIRSKGYNFNFDDIDFDPFTTKTNIRMSPPLDSPNKCDVPEKIFERPVPKKDVNRRKSQPERKKPTTASKRKFNATFDGKINSKATEKPVLKPEDDLATDIQLNSPATIPLSPKNVTIEERDDTKADEPPEPVIVNEPDIVIENKIENPIETTTDVSDNSVESNLNELKPTSSSSEHSTYFSACTTSSESSIASRNVFNIPEIDDVNFNPFATKSKMCQSPPPNADLDNPFTTKSKLMSSPDSSMVMLQKSGAKTSSCEDKIETELMEKDFSGNLSNSSKATDERNVTTKEINTEDEDTVEGPFLDSEDLNTEEKMSDFDGENIDMLQFSDMPPQASEENLDNGEMFIDAEAFEFLLNQNKSNTVADSGKESLFLKFDPLFAKRMSAVSSDGVLASLAKLHKSQSTPTKTARTPPKNVPAPVAGPSNMSVTQDMNVSEEFNDDLNITVSKPMMVVPPAVNPVTPRNKSITPNRSNRRSITFTSPAMAVIDRLLSLSSNSSLLHDTTVTQVSREQNEADVALSQLRELLAEKEINVYNLKCESNELRDRLNTLEGQVKSLEAESEDRLQKINQLNDTLIEKTKINKSMAAVVEEYERTIASLIAETAQDKKKHAEERMKLINERDEQTAHLASMEVSFSDLHSKYEKSKQVILNCKANEEVYRKSIKEFEENLTKMQNNYELLKQHATSKLNHANQELEKINRSHEAEVLKLNAMIKRKELHITSLEESLAQKTKANDELTAICDELINKVG